MKLPVRACGAALAVGLSVLAGCGGNVVLDHETGGAAGSGAGGGTTITTTPTSTTITTTTTITGTTTTITGTTTTTTITGTTTTTWSGMPACDNSGVCNDGQNGCIPCSIEGECSAPYDTCINGADCIPFSDCINNCGGAGDCVDSCTMQYPTGAQQYNDLVMCVICWSCYNDCDGAASGCPN